MKNLFNQLFNTNNKGISKSVTGQTIQSSNYGTVFAGHSGGVVMTGSYQASKFKVLVLAGNRISYDTFLELSDGIDKKNKDYFFVEKESDLKDVPLGGFEIKILDGFCLNPNIVEILSFISKKKLFLYT